MPDFHDITRRNFIKSGALAGAGLFWSLHSVPFLRLSDAFAAGFSPLPNSPIEELASFPGAQFNGDDTTHPHDALWNKEEYIRARGGRPRISQKNKVVVVGGGMSGLLSAYFLRDFSPLLLEQAPRLGGNSKGESFQGTAFSIGAAYIGLPEKGGAIESLFGELGLRPRLESEEESRVFFQNRGLLHLWSGETDPAAREQFRSVAAAFREILEKSFPSIPWEKEGDLPKDAFEALDAESAAHWLARNFPGLHSHLAEYFQLYAWSSFGGSLEEISAAQFLNFITAETQGVLAFPGGNSAVARALAQALPRENLRSSCMVLEVKNNAAGAEVLFENQLGQLESIQAEAVVMAAPKFVARYLLPELSPARNEYWKNIPYRSYVVANVLLNGKTANPVFDSFRLEGKVPDAPSFGHRSDRAYSDFVFAGWAQKNEAAILTFYKPYPFEGARSLIMSEAAHERVKNEILAELPKTLATLGLSNSVAGIRLTRWGHALPLAQPGRLSESGLAHLGEPLGRIAFANQDNFMNPSFESCFSAAQDAAGKTRKTLS